MVRELSYIISRETNPWHNIALEEYLLEHVREEECILYLWQNRKTVVIGYNQNPWRECRTEQLEAEGGFLARRLSGGGAVFHDLGNVNFTFLVRKENYDVERQSEVILQAVQSFGIPAIRNGRNDLTVEDRKFSGNAFYRKGDHCYHHGTILLSVDKEAMSRYLSVSREKLQSKGVESVKSRVVNLREYVPGLSVEQMQQALIRAFGDVYGGGAGVKGVKKATVEDCDATDIPGSVRVAAVRKQEESGLLTPQKFSDERLDPEAVRERETYFGSWEWRYGRKIPFQYEVSKKFPWGEVVVQLAVSGGRIDQIAVWSDGLEVEFPRQLEQLLQGCPYQKKELMARAEQATGHSAAGQSLKLSAGEKTGEETEEKTGEAAGQFVWDEMYRQQALDVIELMVQEK